MNFIMFLSYMYFYALKMLHRRPKKQALISLLSQCNNRFSPFLKVYVVGSVCNYLMGHYISIFDSGWIASVKQFSETVAEPLSPDSQRTCLVKRLHIINASFKTNLTNRSMQI
jgi:hypothetical protein